MALVVSTDMTPQAMTERVAATAAHKDHKLARYLVDGQHPVNPAQYDGIMRHLRGCPDLPRQRTAEENMAPSTAAQPAQESPAVIADILAGFYATPSRTGSNDLDFWKVTEGRKPGIRFVKRVIGGGDTKYPHLVDVSRPEQFLALNAILQAGIGKAREEYADNEERCMRCGAQLTDNESRTARMGPVCRGDR